MSLTRSRVPGLARRAGTVTIPLAVAGVVIAGGLGSPAGARGAAAPGPGAAPLNCDSSFNPYAHSRAAVSACGYPTFPRVAAHALPGGGTSYDYLVHGLRVRFYVPPKGFDPATAANARLSEYGFPTRPATDTAAKRWAAQMRAWKGAVTPPPFLAETRASADTVYTYNWSGYAVSGSHGTYTHAEAWYIEPTYYGSACSTNAEVTWAGLGGYNGSGDDLGQDGTGHGVPGMGNHQAWWEIVPGYNIVPVNFYGHSGYLFDASTRWLGNGYRFYLYDYYSATTDAFDVSSSTYSGDSAEAVAERPTINGSFSDLSNFGTLTFSETQANGVGFDQYSASGTRHGMHMIDTGGNDMADPSDIGSDGYFTDTQHSCQ
jgi:Peptidase A4 family